MKSITILMEKFPIFPLMNILLILTYVQFKHMKFVLRHEEAVMRHIQTLNLNQSPKMAKSSLPCLKKRLVNFLSI